MRKTFKLAMIAAAAAAAMGSVQAAEVTLYGSISTGVLYKHSDELTGGQGTIKEQDSVSMESAWYGDSIWGLTGTEELGNGWTVGFTLENEFTSDDGNMATPDAIFDSQSYLRIGNDKAFLIDVVSQCLPYIGYPRSLNAMRCISQAAE